MFPLMVAQPLQTRTPDLIADVRLYTTADGGRQSAVSPGYRCSCFASRDIEESGWIAQLQLGDQPLEPGAERRVGFFFVSPEAVPIMKEAGRFYLREGRLVGEALIVK